jgi:putative addiction module component (TIGR02574 family)
MDSAILTSEALKLPAWERAQMIDALWRSLDQADQTSIDQAWIIESRERLQAYREGKLQALDGDQVLREVEDSLRR